MFKHFQEPELTFGFGQKTSDPRDGLLLFGPHETLSPYSVNAGVIATSNGIKAYGEFVERINKPIYSTKTVYGKEKVDEIARPSFPGFEAVYGVKWTKEPEVHVAVDSDEIDKILKEKNKKKRTSAIVDYYLLKLIQCIKKEDVHPNIWFIVLPRAVYFRCKPGATGRDLSSGTKKFIEMSQQGQGALAFPGEEEYLEELQRFMDSSSDFHHLLKARLIQEKIQTPVQIILESTLNFRDKYKNVQFDENMKAHLAWTQSASLYYKLGKLPWKLGDIRDGVCYLGLVFKKTNQANNAKSVCSAAQMFLKDGDGSVFRGNIGLWQSANEKEYHLDKESSCELLGMALDDYYDKWKKYPVELFIHGRARFSPEEWEGFTKAIQDRRADTKIVGIVIKSTSALKLFRDVEGEESNYGVMRGLSYIISEKEAYLFTRGFIPRLNTSSSLEIPNPLHITISRGDANIETVLKDVLALTKLNYNACVHGDGLPVTLRFSNLIGSILTATEQWKVDSRQFKYYI